MAYDSSMFRFSLMRNSVIRNTRKQYAQSPFAEHSNVVSNTITEIETEKENTQITETQQQAQTSKQLQQNTALCLFDNNSLKALRAFDAGSPFVAYAFLVDGKGRVRFRGAQKANEAEIERLIEYTHVLLKET